MEEVQTCIKTKEDVNKFGRSETRMMLVKFIDFLRESVVDVNFKNLSHFAVSESIELLKGLLNVIGEITSRIKCHPASARFGNLGFRDLLGSIESNAATLTLDLFRKHSQPQPQPEDKASKRFYDASFNNVPFSDSANILLVYLTNSFGNKTRIDYGTGHELNFICFLLCLYRIGYLKDSDGTLTVAVIFKNYLSLARRIQAKFNLEPAGSRGVWGIDDFQFLPFVFGSSQLKNFGSPTPADIIDPSRIEQYYEEFLYVEAIRWIYKTKRGVPIEECSPILYDLSRLRNWKHVSEKIFEMYQSDVLNQVQVMQHFLFCKFIPYPESNIEI